MISSQLAPRAFARTTRSSVASRKATVTCNALLGGLFTKQKSTDADAAFYNFNVKSIDGQNVNLAQYKGKVVLVVNTASACGFTPQFAELQQVYDRYKNQGFVVLGFPCNQFGAQDPGSNADIKKYAKDKYGVTFPLFAKIDVNGPNTDPLFGYLKSEKAGLLGTSDIKWNFSKFLLDKEGNVYGRYAPTTTPGQLEKDIKKLLAA